MSTDKDQAMAKVPKAVVAAAGVAVAEAALNAAHYYLDEATTQADQARSAAGTSSEKPIDSGRQRRQRIRAASAVFAASEHAHAAISEVLDADRILADLDNTVSTAFAWEIAAEAHREAARAAEHMASAR